jgi:hypothetical protein
LADFGQFFQSKTFQTFQKSKQTIFILRNKFVNKTNLVKKVYFGLFSKSNTDRGHFLKKFEKGVIFRQNEAFLHRELFCLKTFQKSKQTEKQICKQNKFSFFGQFFQSQNTEGIF